MRRRLSVLAALLLSAVVPDAVLAQGRARVVPVAWHTESADAQIQGLVKDDAGSAITGASVLAMGETLAMVRTDERGRFTLRVPPGDYVLRATREGYVSRYREPVRITAGEPVTRVITLTRTSAATTSTTPLQLAGMSAAPAAPETASPEPAAAADPSASSDASHSEASWRLRHLPRTVLRDESPIAVAWDDDAASWSSSLRESVAASAGRAAASFLGTTDFNGHVDFLTMSSLPGSGPISPVDWPRGVAYVVVGAPVSDRGDWSVRAALTAGDFTSWTLLGEYQARADRTHAFRTGASYSAQVPADSTDVAPLAALPMARRAGGVYWFDRWMIDRRLELDYGGRVDRYDYLADPDLVSGTLGARVALAPRMTLVASAAPHMVAPGADQFLPPAEAGTWLPPERTFSALDPGGALLPERVDRYDLVLETRLTRDDAPVVRVGRFTEATADQMATLFGLDDRSAAEHYYVSSPGDVRVDGWVVGVAGSLSRYVQGTVDYRAVTAAWNDPSGHRRLRRVAPSVARRGVETGQDLTTSVRASVPMTATTVNVAYRFNTAFAVPARSQPASAGRFKVEVQQLLPFRPLGRGELNLLFSARTLLRDVGDEGAYFDELLTIDPPLRVTCGLQMRF
jgi:hypothetical protein